MKRSLGGVAAAFILFSAGQAAAEGLPPTSRIAAPVPVGPNWNGFYIGAGIGVGSVVHDLSASCTYEKCYDTYTNSANADGGAEGIFGTVTIGFDRVVRPGWVLGAFADYDFGSNISGDVSVSLPWLTIGGTVDHNYSWAVGGRLGYLANPSTLLYGTAGYTQAEFEPQGLGPRTFDGFFVGAGVETFLRQNWTLKFEYRYAQFDSENLFNGEFAYCDDLKVDLEPSMHTARLVLSYKFGGHREAGSIKD